MKKEIFKNGLIALCTLIAVIGVMSVADAGQRIEDMLHVDSLKVGNQGAGGVTYFNGTIINETTDSSGNDIPLTIGDGLRVDGVISRGATASTGDDTPVKIQDDLIVDGRISTNTAAVNDLYYDNGRYSLNTSLEAISLGATILALENDEQDSNISSSASDILGNSSDIGDILDFIDCIDFWTSYSQDYIEADDWDHCKLLYIDL